ncbi:MAG: type II toxin-antitoxin system RelE/ParE family toxin [Burkholderiales bacterium]
MARRKHDEYRLTPAAIRDLESIWMYTTEQWGIEQVHRYTDELTNAFKLLANNPEHGGACDHVREGYRRHRAGCHVIYYRIVNE